MSSRGSTITMVGTAQPDQVTSPIRLHFDKDNKPTAILPPPASSVGGSHQRSKTAIELPHLSTTEQPSGAVRSSTFLPFRKTSRQHSPERSGPESVHSSNPESETAGRVRLGTVGRLSSWFEGTSEPVNISIIPSPKKELPEPFYKMESTTTSSLSSQDKFTQRPSRRHQASPSTANSSVFSFFRKTVVQPQVKADPDDLLQMDISDALIPEGAAADFSPEAFKALRQTAEVLCKKFQLAYAENLGSLRQLTSEKNIQTDELEASQTRNEHLKLQLLEMAEKAAEQEKVITDLRDQLHKHQQSIRMISEDEPNTPQRSYRRNRHSDCSFSDESLADSEMSSAVSVFSDVESIRTPATSVAASPVMKHARLYSPTVTPQPVARSRTTPVLTAGCSNCHGVPASEAWDVIGIMKMESMGLKQRVMELENAQDAALDFLSGLNLD